MEIANTNVHTSGVLDIAFDFYGRRFASCFGDRQIHIYDLDNEVLDPTVIITEHSSLIWRISWAHPEFGHLIASCSQDKTVLIYEEQENVTFASTNNTNTNTNTTTTTTTNTNNNNNTSNNNNNNNNNNNITSSRWQKKAQFYDSKSSVHDVKFAPRDLGLKLATISADGWVRIYEATDVFTLNYWPLQDSFYVSKGLTCTSWNDSPFELPRMVIGGESKQASIWKCDNGNWKEELKLGELHDNTIRDVAWAPCMGRSYHLIATADSSNIFKIFSIKRDDGDLSIQNIFTLKSNSGVWRLAWNATGTVLATSSENGELDLWRRDFEGSWKLVQSINDGGINNNAAAILSVV